MIPGYPSFWGVPPRNIATDTVSHQNIELGIIVLHRLRPRKVWALVSYYPPSTPLLGDSLGPKPLSLQ